MAWRMLSPDNTKRPRSALTRRGRPIPDWEVPAVDNDSEARPDGRRRAFGAAIRRFRGDRSQAELGEILGESQTTISRWEAGMVDLGYDQVLRLERALGVAAGSLGRAAGYIDPGL